MIDDVNLSLMSFYIKPPFVLSTFDYLFCNSNVEFWILFEIFGDGSLVSEKVILLSHPNNSPHEPKVLRNRPSLIFMETSLTYLLNICSGA